MPFTYRIPKPSWGKTKPPEPTWGKLGGSGGFTQAGAAFLRGKRFDVRRRGLSFQPEEMPNIQTTDRYGRLVTLNAWESVAFRALTKMQILFSTQAQLGPRNALGGGKVDFLLPDYRIVLDPLGPFHFGTIGEAKDFRRTVTRAYFGYLNIPLYEWELTSIPVCIRRLQQILAAPMAWSGYSGRR